MNHRRHTVKRAKQNKNKRQFIMNSRCERAVEVLCNQQQQQKEKYACLTRPLFLACRLSCSYFRVACWFKVEGGGMSVLSHVLGQVGHQLSRDEDESEKKKKTIVFFGVRAVTLLLDDGRLVCMYRSTHRERERIIFVFFYFNFVPRYYTSYLYVISLLALFFFFSFMGFFTLYLNTHTHMHKVSVWCTYPTMRYYVAGESIKPEGSFFKQTKQKK
jgi:hypothetical protein